jgi:hypothetical protein
MKPNRPTLTYQSIFSTTALFITLWLIPGCHSGLPKDVSRVVEMAGDNGVNLLKVIDHYKQSGDEQKLLAAYYLIGNMEDKYGVYYPESADFFKLLSGVDSLRVANASSDRIDNFVDRAWEEGFGNSHNRMPRQQIRDMDVITADFLIENIDLAFKVWKEKPWCQHLGFDEFCEWILPYRVNNEPLQNWRPFMYNTFKGLEDSLKNPNDLHLACLKVNEVIARDFQFSHTLGFVPMMGGLDAWNHKQGICEHRYQLITMAMRSIGIPVTIDFTPYYPNEAGGHSWTALLDRDGDIKTFNGGEKIIKIFDPAICPIGIEVEVLVSTVYRYCYAPAQVDWLNDVDQDEVPALFKNRYIKNVSSQYKGVRKLDVSFEFNTLERGTEVVYLYAFSNGQGITPVAPAKLNGNRAVFENIGCGGLYLPGYEKNGRIMLLDDPVDLPLGAGKVVPILTDGNKVHTVKLYRKNKVKYTMAAFIRQMQGARIQGANTPDFKQAETLFTIDTLISFYDEFFLTQTTPYRYYRYLATDSGAVRLAELDFLAIDAAGHTDSLQGKIYGYNANPKSDDDVVFENAFDGNVATNFNAPAGSWIALDAGNKVNLHSFKILPRNNLNIIVPGDTYELFYFKKGWHSLGEKQQTIILLNLMVCRPGPYYCFIIRPGVSKNGSSCMKMEDRCGCNTQSPHRTGIGLHLAPGYGTVTEYDKPFHHIAELPDVTGP